MGRYLIYIPHLMKGHPNGYFSLSYAMKIHTNPVNTCPMVIKNPNGQAPTSLDHLDTVMSLHKLSPHDIVKQNMFNLK